MMVCLQGRYVVFEFEEFYIFHATKCSYCDSSMVTFTALRFCRSDCMLSKAVVAWLRKLLACYP